MRRILDGGRRHPELEVRQDWILSMILAHLAAISARMGVAPDPQIAPLGDDWMEEVLRGA